MKKSNIIKMFSILTMATAGAFAVGAGLSNKKAEAVEAGAAATTRQHTIWLNYSSCNWFEPYISYKDSSGNWTHKQEMTIVTANSLAKYTVPANTATVIFSHTVNWHSNNCQTDDQNLFYASPSTSGACVENYFTLGSQPGDANSKIGGTWSYNTGISNTIVYNNNTGSGTISNQTIWLDNATLSNGSGFSKAGYALVSWNTESDGTGTSYSLSGNATYTSFPSMVDGTSVILFAQWVVETSGRYIVGKFGTCNWSLAGAVKMTEGANNEFTVQSVPLSAGDVFKVAYYNRSQANFEDESYIGYWDTIPSCGGKFCFGVDGNANLVCVAEGLYDFYFKQGGYDYHPDEHTTEYYSLSVERHGVTWNAEQLAAKLMSFGPANPGVDGDHSCLTRFGDMKTIFLGLSDGTVDPLDNEQAKFRGFVSETEGTQFRNAYDRYVAWAAANGVDPWTNGGSGGGRLVNFANNETTNIVVIITIVSLVSLSAVGGFFFIRKRKEN